jgi:L-ascorbate metabolism protein UlaG (beta-lactamase superfamily)
MIGLTIAGTILLLVIITTLFLNFYPSFGGSHSDEKEITFNQSGHYEKGNFINQIPTSLNMNTTMWASWIIKSKTIAIYFSGDSGYGPHFQEIGERYGPFDFAMLECGQYDQRWESIHMMPEQTAQAALDINANMMMPIHWGAFVLALHSWKDPVERVTKKAQELNVNVITPKIGEQFLLNEPLISDNHWWVKWN